VTQRPAVDPSSSVEQALGRAWRDERAGVVAVVARRLGDLGLAEDAVQEAFAAAAVAWARTGVPDRPGAWLTTAAWRKALDALRKDRFPVDADPQARAASAPPAVDDRLQRDPAESSVDDDLLALVLTCCHPALSPEAQVALTLRHVVGLDDRQIAARFLVSEATMSKRLVRARAKIRHGRISFALPDRTRLEERLVEVRAVLYLVFTEGYLASGGGPAVRLELCDEAVWLCRQLHRLVPGDAETTGLLALMLLHGARGKARRTAPADWSPSTSRTGRCGTRPRSRRPRACSPGPAPSSPAPTSCRRPSRCCTRSRRTATPSSGGRSHGCTPRCSASRPRRP
jgi:RNA polymerase sigma-70 factor (ECF subfamily)